MGENSLEYRSFWLSTSEEAVSFSFRSKFRSRSRWNACGDLENLSSLRLISTTKTTKTDQIRSRKWGRYWRDSKKSKYRSKSSRLMQNWHDNIIQYVFPLHSSDFFTHESSFIFCHSSLTYSFKKHEIWDTMSPLLCLKHYVSFKNSQVLSIVKGSWYFWIKFIL